MRSNWGKIWGIAFLSMFLFSCGDDNNQTEVDRIGIGGECTITDECNQSIDTLTCLTVFKGGYCGKADCQSNFDCPEGSICVNHEGSNYCFRSCADKLECNSNRTAENESNCSSSFDLAEKSDTTSLKACIPPSGSTL